MFEKEIERLNSLILSRTIGNSENISVKEILASEIPLPLRTLIRVETEQKLTEELKGKFVNSRFDFLHPEVVSLQNQMNSILVLNYTFYRQEYLELVQDSINLLLNYLIRPLWTLKNFIFEGTTQVSSDLVKNAFKHFGAYEYLKEIILRIIYEKNIQIINIDEFQNMVWKCDREFIRRRDGFQVAQITGAIYDFINYGLRDTKVAILLKGLIKFFDDKGLRMISDRLQIELQRNVETISLADLSMILDDLRRNSGVFEAERIIVKAEALKEKEIVEESVQTPAIIKDEQIQTIDVKVVEQEEIRKPGLTLIENFINEEERRKFIKKIFNKNEKDYLTALSEINEMKTWKDASVYIDEIFIINEIDPYLPEAVRFTEIAYRRFFPKIK